MLFVMMVHKIDRDVRGVIETVHEHKRQFWHNYTIAAVTNPIVTLALTALMVRGLVWLYGRNVRVFVVVAFVAGFLLA